MRMAILAGFVAGLVVAAAALAAPFEARAQSVPSFDCKKARTYTEKAICGRADASVPVRGDEGARMGDEGIEDEDTEGADAGRAGAALTDATGELPPFWSSIRIASSGVGRSAT